MDSPHDLQVHYSQGHQHNNVTALQVTVFKTDNKITKNATTNITPLGQTTYRKKKYSVFQEDLELELSLVTARGAQIFQKYRSHLKILCIRRVTCSSIHTEDL